MKKKGFLAGTFDHFHIGHQYLLWQASSQVDELVIVVARDTTVQRIKGCMPRKKEQDRYIRIQKEGITNARIVLGYETEDFLHILREQSPDILFIGYDQKAPFMRIQKEFPDLVLQKIQGFYPEYFKSSKF